MSVSTEVRHSNIDTPRSPVSMSADSSRRDSLKQVLPEMHSNLPTPSSPRIRLTRKRAASLNTDSANESRIGELALNSASTSGPPTSDLTREQVCLCQPDPKIPRPRNAFILYRQHYQAQVVSQHPGLANPEISKIIGEQWREQAPEVKSDWKRLAEEEKQRHQRQYPGYRYQPRRAGKLNGLRLASSLSGDDPIRCPKCNGRYISTPSTPSTPFTPALSSSSRTEGRFSPYIPPPSEFERPRYTSPMQNRMDTPRVITYPQNLRRPPYLPPQPLQTHHEIDEGIEILSPSQGQKRRRYNDENLRGYAANSTTPYAAPQQLSRAGGPLVSAAYRQALPGSAVNPRHGSIYASMGPPSSHSPINQQTRHQYQTRSNNFDESLRLPPLQTQADSTATSHRIDPRLEARETQAKSVEAMVMTIPYINKIKVLTKISPPLAPPGPTSPAQEIRGAVVAVEGTDKALLSEIGTFIDEYLSKELFSAMRSWGTSDSKPNEIDTEMAGAPKSITSDERDPFIDYLSIISDWHKRSQEIIRHITTAPPREPSPGATSKIIPVALVPRGFSLSTSDTFALRIPINDSYAPVDHWQWMATLWRGIVGPDLTVYVCRTGREELLKYGGVEIRQDCACIVVRIPEGSSEMDEKTARRLGFEVVEFVRNVEAGFGRT